MPMMPLRRCPTCRQLVTEPRCPTCVRRVDDRRGSSARRGYGARWQKYRAWFLDQWPLCGDRPPGAPVTTDSRCRLAGLRTVAVVVDHIVPVTGPTDPTFFVLECHQSLCVGCHDAKRSRESRGDSKITSARTVPDRRARGFSESHKGGYVIG
jgi:5-methylcytosine-specific restriction endonuclease McrA